MGYCICMSSSLARKLGRPATYADLQALPEGVKGEIIDGELYVQPRPLPRHTRAKGTIFSAIQVPYDLGRGGPGGWWILAEPGIELPRSPEFSPNVAGWRRERLAELPVDTAIQIAPDWICEVLSPAMRHYGLVKKRPFYAQIGVSSVWYVDLEARTVSVSRRVDRAWLEAHDLSHLGESAWLEVAVHGGDERVRLEPFPEASLDLALWWGDPPRPAER